MSKKVTKVQKHTIRVVEPDRDHLVIRRLIDILLTHYKRRLDTTPRTQIETDLQALWDELT